LSAKAIQKFDSLPFNVFSPMTAMPAQNSKGRHCLGDIYQKSLLGKIYAVSACR